MTDFIGERTIAYTYDGVGNRLTRDDSVEGLTTYTYDANDQLLQETLTQNGDLVQTIDYTYDDNGNLITREQDSGETTRYRWDAENRLIGLETPAGDLISYIYDTDGLRVSSTVNGNTTDYLLDKNRPYAQVLAELDSDMLVSDYVYGHDLIVQNRDNEQAVYLVDGLGSTRALTDANGDVTDVYAYDAFGNLINFTGDSTNNYLFAGEQFDTNLNAYYLRQRYYDPSTGRFARRDTYEGRLADPVSLHKYLYANANPVSFVDPSGLFSVGEIVAVRKIRETLARIQAHSGQLSIQVASKGGDPSVSDLFWDNLLQLAAQFLFSFALSKLGSLITRKATKVSSGAFGRDRRPMKIERIVQRGEKIDTIVAEAKEFTFTQNKEIALVKLKNGQRALVSGGTDGLLFKEGQIQRLYGHSHPYQYAPTGPSTGDIDALSQLGQQSSYLLERGLLYKFGRKRK